MEQIHEMFAIELANFNDWKDRSRKNNFFELVYVLEGTGSQSVNYVNYPYEKNSIFLLPTAKCHKYIIGQPTRFLFIRFTGSYFFSGINKQIDYSEWFSRLNFIMGNHEHHAGELIDDNEEKAQVKRLLDVIIFEYERKDICATFIIQSALVSVLGIICRSIQKKVLQECTFAAEGRFADLLNFISFNILDSHKLSVPYLSEKFNIAETYFSEYFKRNASERFQDYVLRSKLRIAETRAKFTDTPFQEIAFELGFTDGSHLNKMMKKHFGKGMREIRTRG